jgi:hypothetical protein
VQHASRTLASSELFEVSLLEVLQIVERRCFYVTTTRNDRQTKNK